MSCCKDWETYKDKLNAIVGVKPFSNCPYCGTKLKNDELKEIAPTNKNILKG